MSILILINCYLVGIVLMVVAPNQWYGGLALIISGTVLFFNLRNRKIPNDEVVN